MVAESHLAELSDIADPPALESTEVRSDAAVLEVYDTSERLIEQRSNGQDWKVARFCLCPSALDRTCSRIRTYCQRVDHGLESKINFASANNLGHILVLVSPGLDVRPTTSLRLGRSAQAVQPGCLHP